MQNLPSFLPLYIEYPGWIQPEIFPGVPVLGLIRWYGLMYVFAFTTAFLLLKKEMREGALDCGGYKANEDDIFSFIAWGIVFLLAGARIFSCLVYDTSGDYVKKPWLIFWPFDPLTHKFSGFAGMSYHGGFIGGFLGILLWCAIHKKPLGKWIDAMAVAIPLGYTFGRIGNFLNGELYGRITTVPWGMVFPRAKFAGETFSASIDWVREFAAQCGMTIADGQKLVNLPRHPSQLYEAFFEGIVLFLLLWFLRKRKPFDGFLACMYAAGYGAARFIIEYFRQPDSDLGFRLSYAATADEEAHAIYRNTSLLDISTGQILCALMVAGSLVLMLVLFLRSRKRAGAAGNSAVDAASGADSTSGRTGD
ncbi:MAG: prolipoprotein diacylglyceryl transferase [Treponema sp.]|nr:prolipoprotein diacylglyceryl transferase [Treponema sp.]